jgi:hypothetical protein
VRTGSDNDLLIVHSDQRTQLVDPAGRRSFVAVAATGSVLRLPYSRDGAAFELRILTSGQMVLCDLATGKQVTRTSLEGSWQPASNLLEAAVVGGRHLVQYTADSRLTCLDLETGEVRELGAVGPSVHSMAAVGDEVVGICVGHDLELRSVTRRGHNAVHRYEMTPALVAGSAPSDDQDVVGFGTGTGGLVVALTSEHGTRVHIVGPDRSPRSRTLPARGRPLGVAAAQGWTVVVVRNGASELEAWDPGTCRRMVVSGAVGNLLTATALRNAAESRTTAWLPVDGEFGWLSVDERGLLFAPTSGGCARRLVEADLRGVTAVDAWVEPSGAYAVTGGADGVVRLWNLASGPVSELSVIDPVVGVAATAVESRSPDHVVVVTTTQVIVLIIPKDGP